VLTIAAGARAEQDSLSERDSVRAEIDAFVAANQSRFLWWIRPDFLATDDETRRWLLMRIQDRADRETFARASELKSCLSRLSNDVSAES